MPDELPRGAIVHRPSPETIANSHLTRFAAFLRDSLGLEFDGYAELHDWSVADPSGFWRAIWDYFEIESPDVPQAIVEPRSMPGARWFPGARLNYAAHALRAAPESIALVGRDESGQRRQLTYAELSSHVAGCRAGLRRLGVARGDRVAGYLPNCIEAVVAFLATASLGAIWSSCPPEFGTQSVLDRFAQIEPKVLIAVDGYAYGGRWFERGAEVDEIRSGLAALQALVLLRRSAQPAIEHRCTFAELCHGAAEPEGEPAFVQVEFEHPLWILYSSGTTGTPKAIVHGHGGIVLEHCKILALHSDLGPGDRFFWYSTTGWMMWNYLVSGLLRGCTVVLYEGNPAFPDLGALWRMAGEERLDYFGTSAPFLMTCRDSGLKPAELIDLSTLRAVGSTGAPLPPEGYDWVYANVNQTLHLGSVSGGTDLCTAFVTSCPWLPVRRGELQCSALGAAVEAFDPLGQRVRGHVGELVLTQPMPSMPVFFWADAGGARYRASYFEDIPTVWRHGDWLVQFEDGGAIISGRSDATLNRGGVRMGTSEFYRVVEALPDVEDSLVVDVGSVGNEGVLWLFIVPRPGVAWGPDNERELKAVLRRRLSPRHVPDKIREVAEIPYTLSGKKLELPVKRALSGEPLGSVASPGTLRNPRALADLLARARTD
jgi:acetoacetyl-CoA synthetase